MRNMKRIICGFLCLGIWSNVCGTSANAGSFSVCDARFIRNPYIIGRVEKMADFKSHCFKSLWDTSRGCDSGNELECLKLDREHFLYSVHVKNNREQEFVDEVFISAPIVFCESAEEKLNEKTKGENPIVGTILLSIQYNKKDVLLATAVTDFFDGKERPEGLSELKAENIQYFLNDPTASTELPRQFEEVKNFSSFAASENGDGDEEEWEELEELQEERERGYLESFRLLFRNDNIKTAGSGFSYIEGAVVPLLVRVTSD